MGKYMKRAKMNGNIAVMEIPQSPSSMGVRTRARTRTLQPNPELSYLQLRNRRLEKLPFQPKPAVTATKPRSHPCEGHFCHDVEASCGENHLELDFDTLERSTRESTPCSLIRDAKTIGTPGSTTRRTCSTSANQQARNMQRAIPTTPEMEEFFAGFELHQQKQFIEKYNYDILNDLPLPGRFEWVTVDN